MRVWSLVGDASDGASALRLVGEVQPDVVLMDLRMPGMDGIEAIERIQRHMAAYRCCHSDHV